MASNSFFFPARRQGKAERFAELMQIFRNDKIFVSSIRKSDAIDVEFRVIEEPKKIGNGGK